MGTKLSQHNHDNAQDYTDVPSDPALRVKALESLLIEKGLVDPVALDVLVDTFENRFVQAQCVLKKRYPGLRAQVAHIGVHNALDTDSVARLTWAEVTESQSRNAH